MIKEPGVYDIAAEVYHSDPAPEPSLSCSIAQLLLSRSPAHAAVAHPRLSSFKVERDQTKFQMGAALHAMLLGEEYKIVLVDAEDYKKSGPRDIRDMAILAGQVPLTIPQHEQVSTAAESVRAQMKEHPALRGIMGGNPRCEATLIWREPDFRHVWCRCRPDLIAPGALIDFKFTASAATPENWARRTAFDLMYDFRAAFYLRGWQSLTGEMMAYRFVVIENEPPYALSVFEATPRTLELAGQGVEKALEMWSRCLRGNVWPGYDQAIQWLEPPSWAEFRWEAVKARADVMSEQAVQAAIEMNKPVGAPS